MLIEVKIDETILFNAMLCKVVKDTAVTSKDNREGKTMNENFVFCYLNYSLTRSRLIFFVHPFTGNILIIIFQTRNKKKE